MRKEILTGITGITLALGSTSVFADSFDSWDANDDDQVTTDEFYGSVGDLGTYSDWDTNDDGLIGEDEWNSLGWDYDYDTWDADNNNYLDSGEFYDGVYDTYDADNNNYWDSQEYDDAGEAGLFDI